MRHEQCQRGYLQRLGKGDEFHVSTIGNVPPKGLCGSGVIEAMAALIEKYS